MSAPQWRCSCGLVFVGGSRIVTVFAEFGYIWCGRCHPSMATIGREAMVGPMVRVAEAGQK